MPEKRCKIGCNWSPALEKLLEAGKVDLDYIKAGLYGNTEAQIEAMRKIKPVLLHGLGYSEHTGMPNLAEVDFQAVNRLLLACGSPHYGLHLAMKNANTTPRMTDEDIHTLMSTQIQVFKENLCVPLLVENVPDSPEERTVFDHHPFCSAQQMSRILEENGIGFLLDLSHAKVAALYRGWELYDFFSALPLHRVREIHVNGSGIDADGFPSDTHQAMSKQDYELLDWLLIHTEPEIVTLEYTGLASESSEVIEDNLYRQITELHYLCT